MRGGVLLQTSSLPFALTCIQVSVPSCSARPCRSAEVQGEPCSGNSTSGRLHIDETMDHTTRIVQEPRYGSTSKSSRSYHSLANTTSQEPQSHPFSFCRITTKHLHDPLCQPTSLESNLCMIVTGTTTVSYRSCPLCLSFQIPKSKQYRIPCSLPSLNGNRSKNWPWPESVEKRSRKANSGRRSSLPCGAVRRIRGSSLQRPRSNSLEGRSKSPSSWSQINSGFIAINALFTLPPRRSPYSTPTSPAPPSSDFACPSSPFQCSTGA